MQQTVPIKKNLGFTLIELLLVLALVAALTVAGLAAYQIQLRNFKVDKTALQMQQWLQAGMAFKADCGQWPLDSIQNSSILEVMTGKSPLTNLTCPDVTDPNQFRSYMPVGNTATPTPPNGPGPWANFYQIGPYSAKGDADPKNAPSFYVTTDIGPADGVNGKLTNAGKMIAGRLPNGNSDIIGGRVMVTAYANAVSSKGAEPIPPGGGGGAQIVDMEMVSSSQTAVHIKKPTQAVCDSFGKNLVPVLVGAIAGADARRANGSSGNKNNTNSIFFNGMVLDKNGFIATIATVDGTPNGLVKPAVTTRRQDKVSPNDLETQGGNQSLMISACLPNPDKKSKDSKIQTQQTASASSTAMDRY